MLQSADLHLDHANLAMLLLCGNTTEPRSSTRADHKLLMSSVKRLTIQNKESDTGFEVPKLE
jgi:hypothetical protein